MAGIQVGGIGSGLDIESLVSQLVSLEARPLRLLEQKEQTFNAQLSAVGKLKSALSSFQSSMSNLSSVDKFEVFSATSGNEDKFTVSADSNASIGSFSVEVMSLAVSHKAGSSVFADTDTTTIGTAGDTLDLTVNGNSFSVDTGGKTLAEIRDAINSASDNAGVTATIVSEDANTNYLVLTSNDTGTDNAITMGGQAATDLGLATIRSASDAQVKIDGTYTVTRSSNSISDAIDGITLNLQSTHAAGESDSLTVTRDTEAVKESINEFINSYNTILDTVKSLREKELSGDSTLLSVQSRLRDVLNTAASVTGPFSYLSEVGVTTDAKTGRLLLDSSKLDSAISENYSAVAELFANDDQGVAFRLDAVVGDLLDTSDGIIKAREDGIRSRIDYIQDDISQEEYRLDLVEERLRSQFTTLDGLVANMNSTSAYLSQQLANLPGF